MKEPLFHPCHGFDLNELHAASSGASVHLAAMQHVYMCVCVEHPCTCLIRVFGIGHLLGGEWVPVRQIARIIVSWVFLLLRRRSPSRSAVCEKHIHVQTQGIGGLASGLA